MTNSGFKLDCIACKVSGGESIPQGGFIYEDSLWTVNHLMGDTPWRGWLVLQPRRHVEAFQDLSPDELASFSSTLSLIDGAIRAVLHPEKIYICLFAEALDCQHIHFHLIPRYADMLTYGPAIFQLPASEVPATDKFGVLEIAQRLRNYLAAAQDSL